MIWNVRKGDNNKYILWLKIFTINKWNKNKWINKMYPYVMGGNKH